MKCQKCGTENNDGASFCYNCGNSLIDLSSSKLVKLHCKNCNGVMEVDPNQTEITCPFCGEKQVILDGDKVKIEKEKLKTIKEMQKAQFDAEKDKEERADKRNAIADYKKSKLKVVTLVFMVISLILLFSVFKSKSFLYAIIYLIIFGLFLYSYLSGMQFVKPKFKGIHILCFILGCILFFIPAFSNRQPSFKNYEKLAWPNEGLATLLPTPEYEYGNASYYSDAYLDFEFDKTSEADYQNYLKQCKDLGFVNEADINTTRYVAYNDEGYKLRLSYYESLEEISGAIDSPTEYNEIAWPSNVLASLIPETPSHMGKVLESSDETLEIIIGEMSSEEIANYMNACIENGFNVDYSKSDDEFVGNDSAGNSLEIYKSGYKEIKIIVTKSANTSSETANTDDEETSVDISENTNGVTPSFKEAMDSYEAFFDEYIAFMQKYSSSSDQSSMLADYAKYMEKYSETMSKLDAIDESQLSEADDMYYIEVSTRISQKLLDAAY